MMPQGKSHIIVKGMLKYNETNISLLDKEDFIKLSFPVSIFGIYDVQNCFCSYSTEILTHCITSAHLSFLS